MFTKRLLIRQLNHPLDDQPDWLNDPRNTKYSEQRHHVGLHDKRSCADYVKSCSIFWGIQEIDCGEWIGSMASMVDENNDIADLGILIHHEYVGKGYGTEAWEAACTHLLIKLRKVEAGCMASNRGMRRIFEKSGMVYEGERKNHFLFDGNPVNLVQYAKWAGG